MQRFEVSLFDRVFDVTPKPEVWSLDELAKRLTTFAVQASIARRMERDLTRIEAAWSAYRQGEHHPGPQGTALARAVREARQWGHDPAEAAERAYTSMRSRAKKRVKSELRLWSPAVYPPGTPKRGTEHVLRLSCLVLDYDGGLPVSTARALWDGWWSTLHTTWSHTPETPKFRVVLPLAKPIDAARWPELWEWAVARGGEGLDTRTGESSRMWALPAVGSHEQLREAHTTRGPLLDPDQILGDGDDPWDFDLYAAPGSSETRTAPVAATTPEAPDLDLTVALLEHFCFGSPSGPQREELQEVLRLYRQGLTTTTRETLERLLATARDSQTKST